MKTPRPSILATIAALAAFLTSPFTAMAEQLSPGAEGPRIDVTIESGATVNLGSAYDQGPVLVYFYPKSDTPGCTTQACNLRDNFAELADKGVTVFGVSRDTVAAQQKFKDKYNLPFNIVADFEGKVGEAFGVDQRGSNWARQSFLIVEGKVVWVDKKATPASQAADALAALDAAKKSG